MGNFGDDLLGSIGHEKKNVFHRQERGTRRICRRRCVKEFFLSSENITRFYLNPEKIMNAVKFKKFSSASTTLVLVTSYRI